MIGKVQDKVTSTWNQGLRHRRPAKLVGIQHRPELAPGRVAIGGLADFMGLPFTTRGNLFG